MQLHWGWAVLGALVLGGGLAWWMQPADEPGTASVDAHRADEGQHPRSHDDAGPTLYRWIDAAGVVNITDKPPAHRQYTIVHIDPNRNIVPMGTSGNGK
jgi:Domain of unknown function (DUF4124)